MNGLVKARIASITGKVIRLELPDGKMLSANNSGDICSPAMIDTVRWVLLETFAMYIEKLTEPAYRIDTNDEDDMIKYVYYGQVMYEGHRNILLETSYGMLSIVDIISPGSWLEAGDLIKVEGNGEGLSLINISGDNGRMVIE